jgi:hypothetical protein
MGTPRWLQLVEEVGPSILLFTPLAPITPAIVAGIKLVNDLPGVKGPEKKLLVQQIAAVAAAGANAQAGHQVIDPASVATVSGQAIDTIIGVVGIVHDLPDTPAPSVPPQ